MLGTGKSCQNEGLKSVPSDASRCSWTAVGKFSVPRIQSSTELSYCSVHPHKISSCVELGVDHSKTLVISDRYNTLGGPGKTQSV